MSATLTEFPRPVTNPGDLVTGADGNLWVLGTGDSGNSAVSVVAPDGTVKATYSISGDDVGATALTLGPDRNIWFVEQYVDKIGKITPDGVVTEYPIPNATGADAPVTLNPPTAVAVGVPVPSTGVSGAGPVDVPGTTAPDPVQAWPTSIVTGADGALWFTESSADAIGRITTDGAITTISTPGLQPNSIALGPDKAIWFTDTSGSAIDRLNSDGSVSTFPLPDYSSLAWPTGLTTGPDGALWFAENGSNVVGRITTDGALTEIPIRGNLTSPNGLTFDAAGNLWVSGYGSGLARITPQGSTLIVGQSPAADDFLSGITTGPGGAIWFTDATTNQVGRIDPGTVTTLPTDHPLGVDPQVGNTSVGGGVLTYSDTLGGFYDGNPSALPSDFTARIDWGDGSSSDGTLAANAPGQFLVNGSHTYAQLGTYPVTITITDVNPAHTPQPNSLTIPTSLTLSNDPIFVPGPVDSFPVLAAGGGSSRPIPLGSFTPTSTHPVAAPGSKTSGGPGKVAVKHGSTTPAAVTGPSATTLLRAGFVRTWFMARYAQPAAPQVVTVPKKATHTAPVARPKTHPVAPVTKPKAHHPAPVTKPVKPVPKTGHK